MKTSRAKNGASTIEALMALGIFAISLTSVLAMQLRFEAMNKHAFRRTLISGQLAQYIERMASGGLSSRQICAVLNGDTSVGDAAQWGATINNRDLGSVATGQFRPTDDAVTARIDTSQFLVVDTDGKLAWHQSQGRCKGPYTTVADSTRRKSVPKRVLRSAWMDDSGQFITSGLLSFDDSNAQLMSVLKVTGQSTCPYPIVPLIVRRSCLINAANSWVASVSARVDPRWVTPNNAPDFQELGYEVILNF